jgi:hypothetical protein
MIAPFLSRRSEVYCVLVVDESADNYHFNFIFVKPCYLVFDVLSSWSQCRLFRLYFIVISILYFRYNRSTSPLIKEGRLKKQPFNWIFPGSGYIAGSLTVCIKRVDPSFGYDFCLFARWVEPKALNFVYFCVLDELKRFDGWKEIVV